MNPTVWIALCLATAREYSDLAAQALHEVGCQGVQIEDVEIRDRGEDADLVPRAHVCVTGYFEQSAASDVHSADVQSRLLHCLEEFGVTAALTVEIIEAKDWAEQWRENFPPLSIGRFLIAPSWEQPPTCEETILIRLDPGLAFGTGQHPTTQMCLELLGEQATSFNEKNLLDVGCGSGVLSIAASKLGAQVTASDFDPHCTQASRENAQLNSVDFEIVEAAGLAWCQDSFDVVIANLMSDLLITLTPELARVTKPKGTLIVSGISIQRADEVEAALLSVGFSTRQRRECDGELRGEIRERWAAFVFDAR